MLLPISNTQLIVLINAIALLIFVLEQVRRRRLREEYSWLWLLASFVNLLIAISPRISRWVVGVLGINNVPLAFTFIGIQFMVLILIQYSVRLSQLTNRVKDLAQQIAILDLELSSLLDALGDEKESELLITQVQERNEALSESIEPLMSELRR
jgi:hypothetical protein